MFIRLIQERLKYKILSSLKTKLLEYKVEENKYIRELEEWKQKEYVETPCSNQQAFELKKLGKIRFNHEYYMMYYHKGIVLQEIISLIETL